MSRVMQSVIQQYLFLTLMFLSFSSFISSEFDIKCKFAGQQNTPFWAGDIIAGTLEYAHTKYPEWNITNIRAVLFGMVSYKARFFEKRSRHSYEFLRERLILRSANGSKDLLPAFHNYSWPFSFRLDKSLPPTVQKMHSKSVDVYYYIMFLFEQPEWYRKDLDKTCSVNIQHLSSLTNAKQVEERKKNGKGTHLHVILHKNIVVVGKTFSFTVNLQNWKKALINFISATLLQTVTGGRITKEKSVLYTQTLEGMHSFQNETFHQQFELPVPLNAASTWAANSSFGFFKGKPLVVSHQLQVEAHIRGFYTNIRLKIPLTIIYTNETQN
ncbi:unnamed protein product [Adineta steineri]|uniref:Arrestin C-terminal-like domain-containing protein n=1 Tax=Adineta steineri TaxID=433720 RepID=A0A814NZZ1_9BILA|nr:unnamed protein product [Adineta steineri]